MEKLIKLLKFENGCKIALCNTEASLDTLIQMLKNFELYKSEYSTLKLDRRKKEFLIIRNALNKLFDSEVIVFYDENRKPFLENKLQQISISHSKNLVAVITHPVANVGIDVESDSDKCFKLKNRFVSNNELNELPEDFDYKYILIMWSVKEALYKIIGKDAFDFRSTIHIFPFINEDEGKIKAKFLPTGQQYELNYFWFENNIVVFCKN